MQEIKGGCLCGDIKYSAQAEPISHVLCNCKNCQSNSGSAFAIVVIIPSDTFKLDQGETSIYVGGNNEGLPLERHFCGRCGSPLFTKNERRPGTIGLRAGTLDDTSWVKPQISIWWDSAQNWFSDMENGLPRYPGNFKK